MCGNFCDRQSVVRVNVTFMVVFFSPQNIVASVCEN